MEVTIADYKGNAVVLKSAGDMVSIEAQYADGTHQHSHLSNDYLVTLLSEKVQEEIEFERSTK